MLFVMLGSVRASTARERVARRLQWSYPEGVRLVGEYWLQTPDPNVVSIVEADDLAPVIAGTNDWDDVIFWKVIPAVTAEQGMEMAKKRMG